MSKKINVNQNHVKSLDLSPVEMIIKDSEKVATILTLEQQLIFNIDYPREENDPREISEIPEIRLWFIALDSHYPWLPFCLNWREGELARYTAMLVPHQFNRIEGIQYNQEALDIFIMHKVFILHRWLKENNLSGNSRLKAMTQIFGYDLDDSFFSLLN